ncbi:MAG: hypothetical protein ACE5D1_07625 [Fidelibacterota bacterium]
MGGYNYHRLPGGVYVPVDNLDQLKRRLSPGRRIKSRVLDRVGTNQILLRVWNYNVLTQTAVDFKPGTELTLIVDAIEPRFRFRLIQEKKHSETINMTVE